LKRYSDFDKLHKGLKSQAPRTAKLPGLPPKKLFGDSTDKSFVTSRCSRLEAYMNELLAIPDVLSLPCVSEFLYKDHPVDKNDSPRSPDTSESTVWNPITVPADKPRNIRATIGNVNANA
jgi:hypothetical protein